MPGKSTKKRENFLKQVEQNRLKRADEGRV